MNLGRVFIILEYFELNLVCTKHKIIILETLRKYPIFPVLPRICKEDYAVPGTDFILPKNSYVMVSNFGIHRDPEYYPNPLIFDPERFTKENKAKRPFISNMPFGEGPRICIGKSD